MLTVFIYKKSAQPFIDKYHNLFETYCDSGKIAFCFWDESGEDLYTALPQLPTIVREHKCWKAIVVLPNEETKNSHLDSNKKYATNSENPYDYLENNMAEPPVLESKIPLIRLCQMLGGIPLVNRHYKEQLQEDQIPIPDGRIVRRRRYRVEREEDQTTIDEQQKLWDDLNDKYSMKCEKPSYLYLLSAHVQPEIVLPKCTDIEWNEENSSLFWYRNRYPAKTRFLIQNCNRYGHVNYQEDIFRFWMTAMTLAINDFPSGTFEAYKVYNVKCTLDTEELHQVFSDYYNHLDLARAVASKELLDIKEDIYSSETLENIPYYSVDINVKYNLENTNEVYIPAGKIGLFGNYPVDEGDWYYASSQKSIRKLRQMHQSTQNVLKIESARTRFLSNIIKEEIPELSEFQYDQMNVELSEMEKDLLTFNVFSTFSFKKYYNECISKRNDVLNMMKHRIFRWKGMIAIAVVLLVYVMGFIPALVYQYTNGDTLFPTFALSVLGTGLVCLAMFVVLWIFKLIQRYKAKQLNKVMEEFILDLRKSQNSFSKYLSQVATYIKGKRIIQAVEKKNYTNTKDTYMLSKHLDYLRIQMDVIITWLNDFGRSPKPYAGMESQEYSYFDFEIDPEKSREYYLNIDLYKLNITNSVGMRVKVPYPYITGIEIQREYLYENNVGKEET